MNVINEKGPLGLGISQGSPCTPNGRPGHNPKVNVMHKIVNGVGAAPHPEQTTFKALRLLRIELLTRSHNSYKLEFIESLQKEKIVY